MCAELARASASPIRSKTNRCVTGGDPVTLFVALGRRMERRMAVDVAGTTRDLGVSPCEDRVRVVPPVWDTLPGQAYVPT